VDKKMKKKSHDHNFKNLFLDFPVEALDLFLPKAKELWGPVQKIEFIRQEPKKNKLAEGHLVLDMPILFSFDNKQFIQSFGENPAVEDELFEG
jgi:hypothetical protein